MSHDFDPYFKWLAIPPAEQPPNHYRLLGIPLFTTDPDVIANAADQRMSHLRGFQSGLRGGDSQKLLNEVASARVCLLDPTRKDAYDDELKTNRHGQSSDVMDAEELSDDSDESSTLDELDVTSVSSVSSSKQKSTRQAATEKTKRRLTPKEQKLRTKLNVLGHIVSPILGLALAVLIYYLIRGYFSDKGAEQHAVGVTPSSTGAVAISPQVKPPAPPTPTPPAIAPPAVPSPVPPAVPTTKPPIPTKSPEAQTVPPTVPLVASTGSPFSPAPPSSPPPFTPPVVPIETPRPPLPPPVSLETQVEKLKASAEAATTPTAQRIVAVQGVQVVRRAITENRKDLAQECAAPTLIAARQSGSQDLVRQITMLVLEIEKMEVKQ